MNTLTDKELTIIDRISTNGGETTQRQIARHAGLSLGLTNIILKRLTQKGYIKVKQLTPKKMHYILTPKGITEKAQKSYQYIFKTIREIKNINDSIQRLLITECQLGAKKIGILGENELTEIIKMFSTQIPNAEIVWLGNNISDKDIQGIDLLLDCRHEACILQNVSPAKIINMADYIVQSQSDEDYPATLR